MTLPPRLRGNEIGTFTHHSVAVRLPEIARRITADNELTGGPRAAMDELAGSINKGSIEPLRGGADQAEWDGYVAEHVGASWLDVPWFFAEYYFYRRVLDAVGYWTTGRDPYRKQKKLGLEQALAPARATLARIDAAYARGVSTDHLLSRLLADSIWGNQLDLSMWPAEENGHAATEENADRLLIDLRLPAIRSLRDRVPPHIDVVLDNVGSELVADLLLVDLLLRSDLAGSVRLHAKPYPVFVSDATPEDVAATIRTLSADTDRHLRSAGERLGAEIRAGRLETTVDPYWTSPLEWRQRPAALDRDLAEAGLVIVKGDANYRRLLGDRHWPFTTPFAEAIGSSPAPLLVLRTLKSEVVAGLAPADAERARAADADWLTNGRWAVASFVDTASSATPPARDG